MQLDIYNKTTIETETIVYDIVREWQTVYTHKSITVGIEHNSSIISKDLSFKTMDSLCSIYIMTEMQQL